MTQSVKQEIVLVVAAVVAVGQLVLGATTGNLDVTLLTAALTAVGAVFTRQNVTPVMGNNSVVNTGTSTGDAAP